MEPKGADPGAEPGQDTSAAPDAAPDLDAFIAEIEKGHPVPPELAAEHAAASGEDTPKPVADPAKEPAKPAPEPKKDEPAEPVAAETAEVRRARAILAAAAKAERQAVEKSKAGERTLIDEFKTTPSKFLQRAGITLDQLLQLVANEGEPAKPPTVESEVEKLKAELVRRDQEAAQREIAARGAERIAEIKTLASDAAKFPRINASKSHELVVASVAKYVEKHGALPDYGQVAAQVEAYLASLAGPAPAPKVSTGGKPTSSEQPTSRPGSVTLTAHDTRAVPPTGDQYPTDEDARYKAILREMQQASA